MSKLLYALFVPAVSLDDKDRPRILKRVPLAEVSQVLLPILGSLLPYRFNRCFALRELVSRYID